MTIGQSLVFIFEDERQGFVAFGFGCSANNEFLISGPPGVHRISMTHLKRGLFNSRSRSEAPAAAHEAALGLAPST